MVYAKPPFAGPRKLVNYLARYTHRVAISNDRLLDCRDGQVRYTYRDRQDGDRRKVDTLPAEEFLQRFLQHVLPDGFCRIRHYGLLANCVKRQRLAICRRLLGVHVPAVVEEPPHTAAEWMEALLGIDITQCPQCGARLKVTRLPPLADSPSPACQPPDGPPSTLGHLVKGPPQCLLTQPQRPFRPAQRHAREKASRGRVMT